MVILHALLFLLLLLYSLIVFLFRHYWNVYPVFASSGCNNSIDLSIIVAFRNEMMNIQACIRSLEKQTYPREHFEVILTDDHSDDGSSLIAENYCRYNTGFRYCSAPADEHGKKAALIRGIKMSSGKVIVLTDADCVTGEKWLETIAGFYSRHKPEMVIGLVDMSAEAGFLHKFQELEFMSLTGAGAGAAVMHRPLFCSGSNLVFNKELFEEYHDPLKRDVVSGDDTLFMLQLKKRHRKRMMLLKSPSAVVATRGAGSIKEFINQRLRWTSKIRHYRDRDILLTAVTVFLINAAMVASLIMLIKGFSFYLFPVMLIIKTLADYFFMQSVMRFFGKDIRLYIFFIYEIIYMIYVVTVPVCGLFFKFSWKGRRFRS
ncbi:MAG: glycosyltransferase [Bacteroidales bacterium]|nr:glycosyltransferase [Bacteroidales bacterium]